MSRTKIILAAIGAVALLGALAMAYLVWTAVQRKGELAEEHSGAVSTVESLSRKEIYPSRESILAVESNVTKVAEWKEEVFRFVSAGDRIYEKTTAPAFKNFIVAEAKRLASLPGDADGKIAGKDFSFGPFKDYIFEGKMPLESSLPDLQRKWDDVVFIIETLASAGISVVNDIQLKVVEPPKEDVPKKRNARNRRRAKAKKTSDEAAEKLPAANVWSLTFGTRPSGYVKTLNAFAVSSRFSVVSDVSVTRKSDAIVAALGGEEKKGDASRTTGRRRRVAAAASKTGDDVSAKLKNGIVTDPSADEPLNITMTVTVYDFRSLEATDKTEGHDADRKGVSK